MFDRQRLAGILQSAPVGDTRDLAEEVVRLMGANVAACDELRRMKIERDLWQSQAGEATQNAEAVASRFADVLDAVPKTKRAQFADIESLLPEHQPAS